MRSMLAKNGVLFGFVTGKNCGNPRDPTQSIPSVDVLIDES